MQKKGHTSNIHRNPGTRGIADAIDALHERGPGLVCELWQRLDELEAERPERDEKARELARRLVAGLR